MRLPLFVYVCVCAFVSEKKGNKGVMLRKIYLLVVLV